MRERRIFVDGGIYHITSRINNKQKIFDNVLGPKAMTLCLKNAREKYNFKLFNYCIMPTHIHLLLQPEKGEELPKIMQKIKTGFLKNVESSPWLYRAYMGTQVFFTVGSQYR